jgi:hypothetical protein
VNIPELIALYSRVADVQTAEMLNLPRPRLKGGQVTIVESELSAQEMAIMESLVARAEAIKGKRSEAGGDNMLKILGEGLRLATDIRLLDPEALINPAGKIIAAVERIHKIWEEGAAPGLCQIVFLDMGVPNSRAKSSRAPEDTAADDEGDGEPGEDIGPAATGASFNLYEDIRQRLVARGIPREQIAFIHEADNDVKKGLLFEAVREARVRILMGSTSKMGVGTNVQKQLVAEHQLDAPWRPADVEQRDGRILRQGNLNEEVEIYRYITLRSLDAYRWQTLTRKANFIAQLRAGARGVRVAEDIDSPLPEAAMIKAAATGNPLIIEHAELSKELRELEAAKRAQERSTIAARAAYDRLKSKIAESEKTIGGLESDTNRASQAANESFVLTVGDRRYEERKSAGEAIKTRVLEKAALLRPGQSQKAYLGAKLSGFKLEAHLRYGESGLSYGIEIARDRTYSKYETFLIHENIDPVGLVRRFENAIRQVPQVLALEQAELAKAYADLPRLERQLTATAFARSDRLYAVKMRISEIERSLQPAPTSALEGTASPLNGGQNIEKPGHTIEVRIDRLKAEYEQISRPNGRRR